MQSAANDKTSEATRPLLLTGLTACERPAPLFQGDQRAKALQVLTAAITEGRLMAAMQLVNKDPSLSFETVERTLRSGGLVRTGRCSVVQLFAEAGMAAGYIHAVQHGFNPDTQLSDGATLIEHAGRRNNPQEVSLLLAVGASPNPRPASEEAPGLLYQALTNALMTDKRKLGDVSVAVMLLDAGAEARLPPQVICPIGILASSEAWGDPADAAVLLKLGGRLVKAGASLDAPSGAPKMSPLRRALGASNGHALIGLLKLGADVSEKLLGDKDLYALMKSHKLEDFIPQAQSAMMGRRIHEVRAETAKARAEAPAAESDAQAQEQAPVSRRRRMGAL